MEKITALTNMDDYTLPALLPRGPDYWVLTFPRGNSKGHETWFEIHSSSGNSTQLDITIINDVMTSTDCVVSGTSLTWLFVFSSAKHVFKMDNLPRPAITFHEFIT